MSKLFSTNWQLNSLKRFNERAQQALDEAKQKYPQATIHYKTPNKIVITQEPAPNSPLFASMAVTF